MLCALIFHCFFSKIIGVCVLLLVPFDFVFRWVDKNLYSNFKSNIIWGKSVDILLVSVCLDLMHFLRLSECSLYADTKAEQYFCEVL